jgi:hypothetical protein
MGWAENVARVGEERKVYRISVENPEGKRPLGRPGRPWEDGIRMGLTVRDIARSTPRVFLTQTALK